MDFNVLEITGMGTQEIKHSKLLAWMFGDNEHGLDYAILEGFLKRVVDANDEGETLESLKHYLYLPENKRNITVLCEQDNIDLLVVDEANKVVVVIENKVYAKERTQGEDGGQLNKYTDIVRRKYSGYACYFVYLTLDSSLPSNGNEQWMCASHDMVGQTVEHLLGTQSINLKAELVLSSYVDLLKRRKIMEDKALEELCKKVWAKNTEALDILMEYRTTNLDKLYEMVEKEFKFYHEEYHAIETVATDKIYQHVHGKKWSTENWAVDAHLEKHPKSLWFGYYHPSDSRATNEKLASLYKALLNENILNKKRAKATEILKINEEDVINMDEEELQKEINKVIALIRGKIKEFEKTVDEILGA
nr:PD-(D/E)XK nuclease family protein [Sulfurospirillum tamanensis]